MKKLFLVLGFVFAASEARSQTNAQWVYVTVAPSGACQARANLRLLTPNGTLYTCVNGTWAVAGGGGGGTGTVTSVSGTANQIGVATGTTTPVISIVTDAAIPGNPTTTTQSPGNNSTRIATTAFVDASAITINGQTCTIGSTCNVNAGAAANTVSINGGTGVVIGGLALSAHQTMVGVAGVPTAKTIVDCTDTVGQHINYTQSTDSWSCGTSNGTGTTSVWGAVSASTTLTVTHNLGTTDVFTACNDGSGNGIGYSYQNTSINATVFTFTNNQTGRCGVSTGGNGSGGGGGGGGTITSVTATAPIASSGGNTPNITIAAFTGDSGSGGAAGAVPAPASGDAAALKVLGAAGAWTAAGTSTTIIIKGNGGHNGNSAVPSDEYFSTCDASGGAFTLTLPASPVTGELHNIKKIDATASACTVSGNGKTIDGNSTMPIVTSMGGFSIYYNGSVWYIIGVL